MTETHYSSPSKRSPLLAPVLLVILAVSVAAAWWVTRVKSGQSERGAEIVTEIRQRGLEHFWPEPTVQWSLIYEEEDRVGWEVRSVLPTGGGRYKGLSARVVVGQVGPSYWEQWDLSSDARHGAYRAGDLQVSNRGLSMPETTTIDLTDGIVEAVQLIGTDLYQSRAPAPENYLPEGTVPLAMRIVAEQQAEANFRLIFNQLAPSGNEPSFVMVTLAYDGQADEGPFAGADAVIVEGMGSRDTVYLSGGRIVGRDSASGRTVSVDRADLEEAFPNAPALFEVIAARRGVPLPGVGAPQTQPGDVQPPTRDAPPVEERTRVRAPATVRPLAAGK